MDLERWKQLDSLLQLVLEHQPEERRVGDFIQERADLDPVDKQDGIEQEADA